MERLFKELGFDPGLIQEIPILKEIGLKFLSEGNELR